MARTPDDEYPATDGCTLLHPKGSLALTDKGAARFAEELSGQVARGYGFIPFIGAGLSAPSGVPLVTDMEPYLQRCIGLALCIEPGQVRHGTRAWTNGRHSRHSPTFAATGLNA